MRIARSAERKKWGQIGVESTYGDNILVRIVHNNEISLTSNVPLSNVIQTYMLKETHFKTNYFLPPIEKEINYSQFIAAFRACE